MLTVALVAFCLLAPDGDEPPPPPWESNNPTSLNYEDDLENQGGFWVTRIKRGTITGDFCAPLTNPAGTPLLSSCGNEIGVSTGDSVCNTWSIEVTIPDIAGTYTHQDCSTITVSSPITSELCTQCALYVCNVGASVDLYYNVGWWGWSGNKTEMTDPGAITYKHECWDASTFCDCTGRISENDDIDDGPGPPVCNVTFNLWTWASDSGETATSLCDASLGLRRSLAADALQSELDLGKRLSRIFVENIDGVMVEHPMGGPDPLMAWCQYDLDQSGSVDGVDLAMFFGRLGGNDTCWMDFNEDGTTDVLDGALLIDNFGGCTYPAGPHDFIDEYQLPGQ